MKTLLLVSNVILLTILGLIWLRHSSVEAISHPSAAKAYTYNDNPIYADRIKTFIEFPEDEKIVMMGTSFTYYIHWAEMMNRTDISNQGIQGDITEGFKNRISYVINKHPKVCFIEGGANDLHRDYGICFNTTISNLRALIDTFKTHNIVSVLTTIPYGINDEKHKVYNVKVYILNQLIRDLAKKEKIKIVDLNSLFDERGSLKKEYAAYDGGHLSAPAYKIWIAEVRRILFEINPAL